MPGIPREMALESPLMCVCGGGGLKESAQLSSHKKSLERKCCLLEASNQRQLLAGRWPATPGLLVFLSPAL